MCLSPTCQHACNTLTNTRTSCVSSRKEPDRTFDNSRASKPREKQTLGRSEMLIESCVVKCLAGKLVKSAKAAAVTVDGESGEKKSPECLFRKSAHRRKPRNLHGKSLEIRK